MVNIPASLSKPLNPIGYFMFKKDLRYKNSSLLTQYIYMEERYRDAVTERQCVYCAVRNGSLYIIHFHFRLKIVKLKAITFSYTVLMGFILDLRV